MMPAHRRPDVRVEFLDLPEDGQGAVVIAGIRGNTDEAGLEPGQGPVEVFVEAHVEDLDFMTRGGGEVFEF